MAKVDLIQPILNAIQEEKWFVSIEFIRNNNSFELKIYNENEQLWVQIYIWQLFPLVKSLKPVDEYRIQITGVDQFESEPDGKTLILGWWDEGSVFAGFDFNKHSWALGFSPSIQIREEALRKAHTNGFAPWEKDNQEIAIAFRPDFFVEYIRNLKDLHSFGESDTDLQVLADISESKDEINDKTLESVTQKRRTAVVNVKRKQRDNSFKSRVLTSYGQKCAICGIQLKLIDAAHIVPVEHHGSDETNNEIGLCALHHRAFDRSLLTINEKYQILTNSSRMDKFKEIGLDGGMEKFFNDLRAIIHLPPAVSDRPHLENIRAANEIRGWN